MKKIFFNVASGVMFSLALVGCQDDFLNTTPLSEIAESNVWSSAKLAEAAVLDLYQGGLLYNISLQSTVARLNISDIQPVLSWSMDVLHQLPECLGYQGS